MADLLKSPTLRFVCATLFLGLLAQCSNLASAQSGSDEEAPEVVKELSSTPDSLKIEPYTGPPIYLDEVEPPPPPREVDSQTVKIDHYDTDKPMFERRVIRFSDDSFKSDGSYKEFFTNGQVYVQGQYDMGRPDGMWTYYHENGAVAKEVQYREGRPDGEVIVFDPEGKKLYKRNYQQGVRHGSWLQYSKEDDQPLLEQVYEQGKPNGLWRTWYKTGQLRQEIEFKNGMRDGLAREWTSGGDKRFEAEFKDGKQHGVTTLWRPDGEITKQTYEEGKLVDQTTGSG